VFDLSASNEDDALCQTLSSSSPVPTLRWLPESRASLLNGAAAGRTQLAAVTSNEVLELMGQVRCQAVEDVHEG
jgi:hypothetical protein